MDPALLVQFTILLLLIALSAFFSGSETALFSLRMTTLRRWHQDGSGMQRLAAQLMDDHHSTLIVILLGTNFVNILASVLLARLTERVVAGGSTESSLIAGLVATTVIVIFGEVAPKTAAYSKAQTLAPRIAPIVFACRRLLAPVVYIVRHLTAGVLKVVGSGHATMAITAEEYRTFIDHGLERNVFGANEAELLKEIFDLGQTVADSIKCPRTQIKSIDIGADPATIVRQLRSFRHRRLPVVDGDLDHLVGVLEVGRFLLMPGAREDWRETCLLPPVYVPGSTTLNLVLARLREADQGMCFVVDEYGGVDGLITVEDVLEEVVGELHDEFDVPKWQIMRIRAGHWRLSGLVQLHDLKETIPIEVPETSSETVTGLITEHLARIPERGDTVEIGNYRLTVRKVHRRQILELDVMQRLTESGE